MTQEYSHTDGVVGGSSTMQSDPPADTPVSRRGTAARYQVMVLGAVCCLALGGVFVKLSETGPVASGAYRSLLAAPMLFALAHRASRTGDRTEGRMPTPRSGITRRDYMLITLGGVFLACDLCLWNISFYYTTLAESNLLANLVPFVIAPLCYILYRDRIPARLAWPAGGALVGLYILVIIGTNLNPGHLRGDALAFATAIFYALFLVTAKGLRERYEAIRIMAWLSIACGLVCLAVAAALGETLLPHSAMGWIILVALAISSQIFGQTLMAHAVKFLPLQLATVFILFQPVAAAAYGWVIFNQRLGLAQFIGIAILLVAIYWGKTIIEANDQT